MGRYLRLPAEAQRVIEATGKLARLVSELANRKRIPAPEHIPPDASELDRRREAQRKEFERSKWRWEKPKP